MTLRILALAAAVATLATGATSVGTSAQPRYSAVVVFGTSLSDSGNAFALRGGTNTPPDYEVDPLLVPATPYMRGGHHFSNGPTWVEQLARSMALAGTTRPAFGSSEDSRASNFAVGAARAYNDGMNLNLQAQVQAFLEKSGGIAPSDALYAIEMGSNDIRDALVAFPVNGHGAILHAANVSIASGIQALYAAGAREFLVWRAPNLSLTPAVRRLDQVTPGTAFLALQLTTAFNAALDGVVAQLSALPGIRIVRLDAFTLLNQIVADPAAFGLVNVTTACITPGQSPFVCDVPDEYLYWDGIHPSRATHGIAAQEAVRVLE